MAEQLMNGLPRAKATEEANKLRAAGASVQDINNKLLGYGRWKDKKGKIQTYKAKDQGHGKITFRVAKDLQSEKNKEEGKRQSDLKISSQHLNKNQLTIAAAIQAANRKKGQQTDHKIERQTSGQAIRQLQRELKLGLITPKELQTKLKELQKKGIGNDPKNLQPLSGKENRSKAKEVKAKNKALEKLEKKNLSNRYGNLTFKQLFGKESNKGKNSSMKVKGSKTSGDVIKTSNDTMQINNFIDMKSLAPYTQEHVVPGGRVAPIKYI
jgi:hypothetical protein